LVFVDLADFKVLEDAGGERKLAVG